MPGGVRMGVAVSAGCTLVTAPIVWLQFRYLPLVGVPANALAEPAMPVLLGLAFLTAVLDTVAPGPAAVVAWVNGWTATYIAFCARLLGSLPFAEITTTRALAVVVSLLAVAGYALVRLRTPSSRA
jgi:competence protein ComEC